MRPLSLIAGHGGGSPGISSNLDRFLESGWTAVVLSNLSGGSNAVTQKTRELISRTDPAA